MRHKVSIFLLFGMIFHITKCSTTIVPTTATTASISTLSTSPPVFDVEKELKNVVDFTDGLEVLSEVYNSSVPETEPFEIIGKNFKKIMQASRKCGIALHQGLHLFELKKYYKVKKETNNELTKLENLTQDLQWKVGKFCSRNELDFDDIQYINYSPFFEKQIENPFQASCYVLHHLLEDINHSGFINSNFSNFKNNCEFTKLADSLFLYYVENKLYLENAMTYTDYIDRLFINMRNIYKSIVKHTLATYPMCNIFKNGLPNPKEAYEKAQEFIDNIQRINKRFKALNIIRKEQYWSDNNILKIVQQHIFGEIEEDAAIRANNNEIARNIYRFLDKNYQSLGYTYHVGVSNTGTNGNADTLIQCSTECKYIYGINNKDVYIIRNKQVPAYKECNFLSSKPNAGYQCNGDRDSTDLTELAEQIQSACNPTAFSLVRKRLKYDSEDDGSQSFSQKCIGDIYVVMAKNY